MRSRPFIPLVVFNLLFFLSWFTTEATSQLKDSSAIVKHDTTGISYSLSDSLGIKVGSIKLMSNPQTKSGNLAMLLSAVAPGAGQIYAHRYYTIPLIWGFGYYFISVAIKAEHQYMDYRGRYSESVRLDTLTHAGDQDIKGVRDFYRNQRDEFIFYLALTYLLNIVDAYVGATLYDFDVSNELGGSAAIRFRIPFH